ncbi:MAG: dTDP-4-dehydrorhamnose reductase [Gammaproteobacteria bacterium RBG_16_51_14]|nr:MAG: dTDP-4-dehydrorhamnose reductase [Gammaproteobacteria bacterium RBG_16_51_14]
MKVLITGAGGQVGRALSMAVWTKGFDVVPRSRQETDITSIRSIASSLDAITPGIIINCAAYTAVDQAQHSPEQARTVNCNAAGYLAKACAGSGIPLVHISTDYVFDGKKNSPYTETDPAAPANVYGESKLEGEERVRACLGAHIIIRTSGVFSGDGNNFVKTMLKLAVQHREIRVVNDQICCPTAAGDIAEAIIRITSAITSSQNAGHWGTYHFCSKPPATWFDFAAAIFGLAGKKNHPVPKLISIRSAEYPSPTQRPPYSALDCSKIAQQFGIDQPYWLDSLGQVIEALTG